MKKNTTQSNSKKIIIPCCFFSFKCNIGSQVQNILYIIIHECNSELHKTKRHNFQCHKYFNRVYASKSIHKNFSSYSRGNNFTYDSAQCRIFCSQAQKSFILKEYHDLKPKQNQLEQENKILLIDKSDLFRVELNHFGIQSKCTKVPKYSKTHTKASD